MGNSQKRPIVGITGSAGQLGIHCRARLQHQFGFDIIAADRASFGNQDWLTDFAKRADVIVHLAGVNRGTDTEIADGNPALADALIAACDASGSAPDIIYASSIHANGDSVYGKSKRLAEERLEAYCAKAGAQFFNLVLPNLYGEFSKPDYNNFTGTFCHKIARGETPDIHQNSEMQLMHYGEVADLMGRWVLNRKTGKTEPRGTTTNVRAVAEKLQGFHDQYSGGVIPDVSDIFDLRLFNMLRQVMFETQFPKKLVQHTDDRGAFFECVRANGTGQTSVSTSVPGITRGDHFHFNKVERFLVLAGQAKISVRPIYQDKVFTFDVSGDVPNIVDMPTMYTHNITNTGDNELMTLFWSNDLFDPDNPDTYAELV
ncbi:MAG: NAD-dependent epimerase/dehydratase family protein [Rhizobiales bacterium]|nr:NAD-dependent epimerase/dehydratase family protein [Hyphomicrobiales bacterium]